MQTFLPYPDFYESAAVLDSKRLQKQLLEGRQIYNIISDRATTKGWRRHPAVLMWRGYDTALFEYLTAIKEECVNRGINTIKNWQAILHIHKWNWNRGNLIYPEWWGDERFHQSHRNNLYRKNPEHYLHFSQDSFISCCEKCNYWWPSHQNLTRKEV
jgi:hypothetical protein